MNEKIIIVGSGVAGITAATKLLDGGVDGKNITMIDAGKDAWKREPKEVMKGFAGAGLFSDGKYVYLNGKVGGHLTKYVGDEKADKLVEDAFSYLVRFHPNQSEIQLSNPIEEPDFIKPYFQLRMAPTWHVGTDSLIELGRDWNQWLLDQGVTMLWETKIEDIDFDNNTVGFYNDVFVELEYDRLIYCTGKSGIDLTKKLIEKYNLETEPKPMQIGVRFEAPQKYFQKILDVAYDFKLYVKPTEDVSLRSFCTNSNAAYIAEEETFGLKSYNGHSYTHKPNTGMVNFGIMMQIQGVENPFEYQKEFVKNCNLDNKGMYFSPNNTRKPTQTSSGVDMELIKIRYWETARQYFGEYFEYIEKYVKDLDKVFNFGNDFGMYLPEVKFLSDEVIVDYNDLSLKAYSNVHFCGDALSARGIAVSMAQGLYIAQSLLGE